MGICTKSKGGDFIHWRGRITPALCVVAVLSPKTRSTDRRRFLQNMRIGAKILGSKNGSKHMRGALTLSGGGLDFRTAVSTPTKAGFSLKKEAQLVQKLSPARAKSKPSSYKKKPSSCKKYARKE